MMLNRIINYSISKKGIFSNAAEEEIASRSEAISDGAERVLKFSILYTHPHTHPPTHPHILPYILPYIKHY
jgi:hypothetical protein